MTPSDGQLSLGSTYRPCGVHGIRVPENVSVDSFSRK